MKPRIRDRLKRRARRLEFAVWLLLMPPRDRLVLRNALRRELPARRWIIYGIPG